MAAVTYKSPSSGHGPGSCSDPEEQNQKQKLNQNPEQMEAKTIAVAHVLLLVLQTALAAPAPAPAPSAQMSDVDGYGGYGGATDYNSIVGHFKDFIMYFPVMMTTLKETMTGFPKFAEGIRILTSRTGRLDDDDCKCKINSNEI